MLGGGTLCSRSDKCIVDVTAKMALGMQQWVELLKLVYISDVIVNWIFKNNDRQMSVDVARVYV